MTTQEKIKQVKANSLNLKKIYTRSVELKKRSKRLVSESSSLLASIKQDEVEFYAEKINHATYRGPLL